MAPAFADIGTTRFLANGVEVLFPQDPFEPKIIRITRRFDFDPVWMSAGHFLIGLRSRIDDRGLRIALVDLPSSFRG